MGLQIIRQPDGRYAVWSTIEDDFVMLNKTASWIADWFGERARADAAREARSVIAKLVGGKKPYHQFTLMWGEALQLARQSRREREA